MCIYMPVHRPVHLLHLVLCVSVCKCAHPETLSNPCLQKSRWENGSKWEWTSNFEKGHTVLLLCVYASLGESSGTNTSHPVSLFFFFFVSSIQRNMAEMCNYLFEALCFQQVWNMCTSSPLLFPFIFVRLLFLNPPIILMSIFLSILSSPSSLHHNHMFFSLSHIVSLSFPSYSPVNFTRLFFFTSHTRLCFLPSFKVVYLFFAPGQNNNSLLTSISPASFSFQLRSSLFFFSPSFSSNSLILLQEGRILMKRSSKTLPETHTHTHTPDTPFPQPK